MANDKPHHDELLSAFHDGELSPAERETALRLLEESADARSELEDYRALSELVRAIPADPAPSGLRASVMERLGRETTPAARPATAPVRRSRRTLRRGFLLLAGGLTAAAGVLLAFNTASERLPNAPRRGLALAPEARESETLAESAPPAAGETESFELSREPDAVVLDAAARDGAAVSEELASERGLTIAGAEARPPNDAVPGDIYQYVSETDEGELVIVEATVIDVRRALNQMQVLLSNNQVPTVPTSFNLGVSPGEAADEFNFFYDARHEPASGDLALYVESDPSQLNAALLELENAPGALLNWNFYRVPAIADSAEAGGESPASREARTRGAAEPSAGLGGMRLGEARHEDRAEAAPAAPAARAAIPAERFRREPAPAAKALGDQLLPPEPRDAPATPLERTATPLPAAPAEAERLILRNGYQQVVNVPKDRLQRQLSQRSFGVETDSKELKLQADSLAGRTGLADSENPRLEDEDRTPALMKQQAQRRVRMLVVLEPPAKAQAPPPVEAPQPLRKKG